MRPLKISTQSSGRVSPATRRGKTSGAGKIPNPEYTPYPLVVRNASTVSAKASQPVTDLQITVGNIQEAKGRILLAIYDSEANFNQTAAYGDIAAAEKGEVVFRFSNLPLGQYAVMAFHDSNNNGKLDVDWAGLPIKPWGASLQGKSTLGAPEWSDVVFSLPKEGMGLTINLHQSERIFDTLVG
ncbi:MAG: DUF2141 domain-containing protein [Granulosicoccus sp.]